MYANGSRLQRQEVMKFTTPKVSTMTKAMVIKAEKCYAYPAVSLRYTLPPANDFPKKQFHYLPIIDY
jgi:hypothetical protein